MPIACKYCILTKGIKGTSGPGLFSTDEDLYRHLEAEHGIIVRRDGETDQEASERYNQEFGDRNKPRLEYQPQEDLNGDTGKYETRHFIMDTHANYCVVELVGPQAKALGVPIAMILDWLKVQAQPPKEHRRAYNLERAKRRRRKRGKT